MLSAFIVSSDVSSSAFSALRVYAICGGNLPIALVVLISSLVPVAINIVSRCFIANNLIF